MNSRRTLAAAFLLACVLAAYAPGLDNDFVGDDLEWVRFALRVRAEPSLAFSLFSGFVTPVMNATAGFDALVAGTAPWIYNLTGLAFHLLNVALLFALLRSALSGEWFAPFWGAAWWGLHYRLDEAVLWLGGRPHVLVITGILLALAAQRRWLATGRARWLAAIGAAGIFAVLSKESGVMALPVAAAWIILFTPEGLSRARPSRWAGPALLAAIDAAHAAILLGVRGEHQNYYRADLGFVGRLAASHLAALGVPAGDPPAAWLIVPVAVVWALVWWRGGKLARFGLLVMLVGTAPTMLIEFQPPRYRYFPLLGAACVVAAALDLAIARAPAWRRPAAALLALVCVYFAVGVRNDEAFLDEAGRIHRTVRDGFCAAADRVEPERPLAVVYRPSLGSVAAMREAANREVAIEVRNYPPIYVRAAGIEGLAEADTLAALCDGGRLASRARLLPPEGARAAIESGAFSLIAYEPGAFLPEELAARAALVAAARSGPLPAALPGGRRLAVIDRGSGPRW
ncbi:MAG: hypothetical protein HY049_12745 [Acidobacteria bacterium]|nr:hypothetical protein [Acidobacteriota bacterium]